MQIEERSLGTGGRFGYQNQEKINEWAGVGNNVDFKYRGYDTRIGRFYAVDPLTFKYPELTPYQFDHNNPIAKIEIEGLEGEWKVDIQQKQIETAKTAPPRSGTIQKTVGEVALAGLHFTLDVVGMIPVVGEIADGINGGVYLLEGNYGDASLSFAGMVPLAGWFATGAKWTKAAVTISRKYGDEATSLVQQTIKKDGGKEIFTITKSGSYQDAQTVTKDILGDLGNNAVNYKSTVDGPFKGKVTGKQSADGKRYWRVDWDAENGGHINWVNGKEKGSIPFTGDLEQAKRIVDNTLGN